MVQLIVGKKGKGKTKQLLDKVNAEVKTANGNIVYIDKSTKHMFELNNKVRLISATDYPLKNSDEFIGFICGIVSQDHDLASVYLDSFLKVFKSKMKGSSSKLIVEIKTHSTPERNNAATELVMKKIEKDGIKDHVEYNAFSFDI